MPTRPNTDLAEMMAEAASASPADRMNYRDAIAAHGAEAIEAMEPWLHDRQTATIAVQVLRQAAETNRDLAVAVLKRNYRTVGSEITKGDIGAALDALGVRRSPGSRKSQVRERTATYDAMELDDLVQGNFYSRSDLHERGLGGNPQSGISYPADGDYALLFTNPSREDETGYHDRWVSDDEILFYGQWAGAGDMPFGSVNLKFAELSPRLYLFTLGDGAYRFEGRFEYVDHATERAVNKGDPATAIVFRLRRAR